MIYKKLIILIVLTLIIARDFYICCKIYLIKDINYKNCVCNKMRE